MKPIRVHRRLAELFPRCADDLHEECSALEASRTRDYESGEVISIHLEVCNCECHR